MISAIVLVPDAEPAEDVNHAREVVVRSLVWLVSAVVAGVVRDVTLAGPRRLGLAEVADQSGCLLMQEDGEAARLDAAVKASRASRVLILTSGFQPDGPLVEDIDSFIRRASADDAALVLATPETVLQRFFPDRAPVAGVLAPRCLLGEGLAFAGLARAFRLGVKLRTRAARIR